MATLSGHRIPPNGGVGWFRVPLPAGYNRQIGVARWTAPLWMDFLLQWEKHPDLGNNGKGRLTLKPKAGDFRPLDSYEARAARAGVGGASDHNGYAIDIRYDILKPDHQEHMTRRENEAVRQLLAQYRLPDGNYFFWWGGPTASASDVNPGRSVGRYNHLIDEMHFFVGVGVDSQSQASYLMKKLGINNNGLRKTARPTVNFQNFRPPVVGTRKTKDILIVQKALIREFPASVNRLTSRHDDWTDLVWERWEKRCGATGYAALVKLGKKYGFAVNGRTPK